MGFGAGGVGAGGVGAGGAGVVLGGAGGVGGVGVVLGGAGGFGVGVGGVTGTTATGFVGAPGIGPLMTGLSAGGNTPPFPPEPGVVEGRPALGVRGRPVLLVEGRVAPGGVLAGNENSRRPRRERRMAPPDFLAAGAGLVFVEASCCAIWIVSPFSPLNVAGCPPTSAGLQTVFTDSGSSSKRQWPSGVGEIW